MTDWSRITPPNGPEAVEEARATVERLHERLSQEREGLQVARAELTGREQADREQLAAAMVAGQEPKADERGVERAQAALLVAERRHQAAQLALEDAERRLGETVMASRDEWRKAVAKREHKARARARQTLGRLRTELEELSTARVVAWWLSSDAGLDRQTAASLGTLGHVAFSAHRSGDAIAVGRLLDGLAEATKEPEPEPRSVPHQLGNWPAMGPAAVGEH